MIQIANANIVRAIRGLASRSPIPLDDTILFALVELVDYMREIAEELNVPKVYFPNEPGVFSAEGIADAPYILWESVSVHETLSTYSAGADAISTLQARALKNADEHYQAFSTSATDLTLIADCHYRGQATRWRWKSLAQWASPELAGWLTSAFINDTRTYGYVLRMELRFCAKPSPKAGLSTLARFKGRRTGGRLLTTEGPRYSQVMVQLFVYRQAGKRRLYPMEAISARRLRQSKSALLHHLRRIDLSLSRLPKRWGRPWNTPHSRRTLEPGLLRAIFSATGDLLAQAAHIPVHLGSQSESVRAVLRSGLVPGESLVLNDPYAGGTHLPDITMVTPVFAREELMFLCIEGAPRRRRWPLPCSMPVPFTSTGEPVNLSIEDEGIRLAPTPVTAQSRMR